MKRIKKNIKSITAALCIDTILFMIFLITIVIDINNYLANFLIKSIIMIVYTLSNYFFLYFMIIIMEMLKKEGIDIRSVSSPTFKRTWVSTTSNNYSSNNNFGELNVKSKILKYHYQSDEIVNNLEYSNISGSSSGNVLICDNKGIL